MEFRAGKVRYITDLVWRTYAGEDSKSQRAEIHRLVEEQFEGEGRVFFGVTLPVSGETSDDLAGVVGIYPYPGDLLAKPPRKASLAATLAGNEEDAVFLLRLKRDDGHLWYCEIRDGIVVPGTDVWIAEDSLSGIAEEIPEDVPIYVDEPLSVPGHEPVECDIKALLGELEPVALRQIAGAPYRKIAAGAMTVAFIGLSFVITPLIQEALAPKVEQVQQDTFSPEELRAMQIRKFLEAAAQQIDSDGAFVPPGWARAAMHRVEDAAQWLPGWRFAGGECAPIQGCEFFWEAQAISSTRMMFERLGQQQSGRLAYDNATRNVNFRITGSDLWPKSDIKSRIGAEFLSQAPAYRDSLAALVDHCRRWSSGGVKCTFKNPENLPTIPVPALQRLVYQTVEIEGQGRYGLQQMLAFVTGGRYHVRRLRYQPVSSQSPATWRMEVFYVAKN